MNKISRKISASVALTTVCTVALLATEKPAEAVIGFQDEYAPSNWTFVNNNADGFVDTSGAPSQISLTGGDNSSGNSGTTDYTITAPGSGTVSFNWNYLTNDLNSFDPLTRLLNGTETQLTDNIDFFATSQSGSDSFSVSTGDTFGFRIATIDNTSGAGSATFTNFVAPDAASAASVPFEFSPSTGIFLVGSIFGLNKMRKKFTSKEKSLKTLQQ